MAFEVWQIGAEAVGAAVGVACGLSGARLAEALLDARGLSRPPARHPSEKATGGISRRRAAELVATVLCGLAVACCARLACFEASAGRAPFAFAGALGYAAWVLVGLACAYVICACDLRERIIPWESCAALFATGALWQLRDGEIGLLAESFVAAAASWLVVKLACAAYRKRGLEAFGAGDVRAVPACVMYFGTGQIAGAWPLLAGLLVASAALCAYTFSAVAGGKLTMRDNIAFGPFFGGWIYSGVMSSPLSAMWA